MLCIYKFVLNFLFINYYISFFQAREYNDARNEFFVKLPDSYKILSRLSDVVKITFVFSSTDGNAIRLCASFLYIATEKDTISIAEPPLSIKYHFNISVSLLFFYI